MGKTGTIYLTMEAQPRETPSPGPECPGSAGAGAGAGTEESGQPAGQYSPMQGSASDEGAARGSVQQRRPTIKIEIETKSAESRQHPANLCAQVRPPTPYPGRHFDADPGCDGLYRHYLRLFSALFGAHHA